MTGSPTFSPRAGAIGSGASGKGPVQFGQGSASALSMKWSALHDAAAAVATIAGLENAPMPTAIRHYPAIMRDIGGWRRELADRGVEDLTAIMEPGLAALLAALARGAHPRAAALALWHEFVAARDALLALAPISLGGPMRRT